MNSDFGFCGPQSTATYKAGIYNWGAEFRPYFQMMNPSPPALFIIPGMSVGCLPYDALSSSTLECFFSSACLNTTAQWISTLPPSDWPKPLDSSKMTRFSINSTLASIMDEQMIDRWDNTVDFASYYTICAPTQCTYTFVGYGNFLDIITLFIGLVGGLNIALRIIAPLVIQVVRYLMQKFSKNISQSSIAHEDAQHSMSYNSIHRFHYDFSIGITYLFS